MSLKNIINLPTRRIQLPKSKTIVNVRSFTVKEKNNLQLGLESDDKHTISSTLKNVVEACITEDIIINELPLIDVEFIFLQLLKMSTGRYIDVGYKCYNEIEAEGAKEICGYHNDVQFDLDDSSFNFVETPDKKKFKITNEVFLEFKKVNSNDIFESFATMATAKEQKGFLAEQKEKYLSSLSMIYDGDKTFDPSNIDKEEVWEIIEYIPAHIMDDIDEYISEVDRIILEKEFKCHKCGFEHNIKHEGLEDFLA